MKKVPLLVVAVACLAMAFTAESAPRPTGKLKVATPGVVLELKIADKPVPVPNNREVPLPVGTYQPALITCYAKNTASKKPEIWSIKSTGPFGQIKDIEITEGKSTEVTAGPPFKVLPVVAKGVKKAGATTVRVGLRIVGQAGESYNTGSIYKNKVKMSAPEIRIVSEKGAVLSQGKFEYG